MSAPEVEALLFQLGAHRLALELHQISSVLASDEAQGMERLDPRHLLGLSSPADQADNSLRVGLLNQSGPPTVLVLGQILGAQRLSPRDLVPLPPWLAPRLPSILYPYCLRAGQNIVWLLNLDTLRQVSKLSDKASR